MKTGEKGVWTDEEDSELKRLVGKHGIGYGAWIKIKNEMPGECSCPHVGLCFGVANIITQQYSPSHFPHINICHHRAGCNPMQRTMGK
jgi:hypothetical protein